jgi:DNA-binding MarR family transcriptional regulator
MTRPYLRDRLSRGEAEILRFLSREGDYHTIRDIAAAIGTAKETVAYHLYRKQGMLAVHRLSLQDRGLVRNTIWGPGMTLAFAISKKGEQKLTESGIR